MPTCVSEDAERFSGLWQAMVQMDYSKDSTVEYVKREGLTFDSALDIISTFHVVQSLPAAMRRCESVHFSCSCKAYQDDAVCSAWKPSGGLTMSNTLRFRTPQPPLRCPAARWTDRRPPPRPIGTRGNARRILRAYFVVCRDAVATPPQTRPPSRSRRNPNTPDRPDSVGDTNSTARAVKISKLGKKKMTM